MLTLEPITSVAVTVTVAGEVRAVRGVPAMTPVTGFITIPVGRPAAEYVSTSPAVGSEKADVTVVL